MSVPNSMRAGPFVPTVLVKKRYLIFYFFLIWISVAAILLEFWWYWQSLYYLETPILFFIFLPLLFFVFYITMVLTSLIFAKLLLIIVNALHKPREGVFLRDPSDKDYRYWSLRNTIKRWPIWLSHHFPFPFLDNLCFKLFGVKTKFSNSLFEGFVDTEFIDFGENVIVGQATLIQSAVIIGDLLIIKKTVIGDNVRIATHSVIMPGTHIGNNCIVSGKTITKIGQVLEDGWIYLGIPAQKFKENRYFEDGIENLITHVDDVEGLQKKYQEVMIRDIHQHRSLKEKRKYKKDVLKEEKLRRERAAEK